jgi:hypothetical protein
MSQPKEPIPVEKLEELARVLAVIHEAAERAVADFKLAQFESVDVEGWKTLAKGLLFTQRIVKKISGPASPIQRLDVDGILLPHHKKKSKKQSTREADLEKLDAAEAKLKEIRKRKPPSQ